METAITKIEPEFWTDGSVWVGLSEHTPEGAGLAEMALNELKVKNWCFFQTSGTEGVRKWVGLTKAALLASARAVNTHFNLTARDHWLLALPTYHVGGFGILARAHLSGSPVTRFAGKWNAAAFVQTCESVEATVASLVPTQVFDLVAAGLCAPQSLRVVLVGGGALNGELEAAALQLGWPIHRTYGMTETASGVAAQRTPGADLEVLQIWQVSTDADGVLNVRGEALAKGYAYQDVGQWRWEAIPADTGLRTRDRVSLRHEGNRQFLRFVGRESGIVKILGELVALGLIQERLDALRLNLGLLDDAVVCDVPDARKEHALVLVVSQMSDDDVARLQSEVNQTLRPLEHIDRFQRVPAIPRSDLGKVRLTKLRTML